VPAGAPGDPLLVAVPDPGVRVEGKRRVFYRVVTGDSLFAVAEALGVDRRALAGWNQLDPEAHLHPRMVLQAWVAPGFDPTVAGVKLLDDRRLEVVAVGSQAHLERAEARMGRERTTYTAKRRETYEQIGKRYGLTARDLARINKLPFDTVLQPGETCVVYAVKDRTASDRAAAQARAAAPAKKQRGKATKGAAKAKPAAAKAKPAAKAAAEAKRDRPK
jgi:membrane-bound lytic murein transglycosylase D